MGNPLGARIGLVLLVVIIGVIFWRHGLLVCDAIGRPGVTRYGTCG
jgi:hypothetical protein